MQTVITKEKKAVSLRQKEIVADYIQNLDNYVAALKQGTEDRVLEIAEFAEMMHIHPVHLSNTVKEVTGRSSCSLFEERLVKVSKEMLLESRASIKEIAIQLTYDPSNFTKFFKHFVGMTPKQFRIQNSDKI
jgi:AraC family transcriptional regulator, regulatory protein of adaptative response / methylphosphotriester-DNA alkyltransferase methyltransferase